MPNQLAAIALVALAALACSSRAPRPATTPDASASVYARIPDRIGDFELTERAVVTGLETDSLFRFSDGSETRLTVIVYEPGEDVRDDADSQKWTAVEGARFPITQEVRRSRGQIVAYVVSISDTSRIDVAGGQLLQHFAAVPVRHRNGTVVVELQYLYLIDGKFVKVRATVPEPGWQQTRVPAFARDLARQLAGGG